MVYILLFNVCTVLQIHSFHFIYNALLVCTLLHSRGNNYNYYVLRGFVFLFSLFVCKSLAEQKKVLKWDRA